MKKRYLISTSGGETSATMAKLLFDKWKLTPVNIYSVSGKIMYTKYVNDDVEAIFVFANTSREDERTLRYVHNIEVYWGIKCVWVEAVVNKGRVGTTHKIVNYNSANRKGNVFEAVIAKYGIPNKMMPHCTRELKQQPINSFCKSIGWRDHITVIGYRFDEPKRVNLINAEKNRQWYPLYEWRIIKADVKAHQTKQLFRLGLSEEEGNCKLCYKKSRRKLLTQIVKNPQSVVWVQDMEGKYRYFEKAGRNNETIKDGTLFFRDNTSINELIEESKLPFVKFTEKNYENKTLFDIDLDEQESCAESCEPFAIN